MSYHPQHFYTFYNHTEAEISDLVRRLDKLNDEDYNILLVLAVVYVGISQNTLKKILAHLSWRTEKGKPLEQLLHKDYTKRLANTGLLIKDSANLYCHHLLTEILARRAVQLGIFQDIAHAVEKASAYRSISSEELHYHRNSEDIEQYTGQIRFALYTQRFEWLESLLFSSVDANVNYIYLLNAICTSPFDEFWFEQQAPFVQSLVLQSSHPLEPKGIDSPKYLFLKKLIQSGQQLPVSYFHRYAKYLIYSGYTEEVDNFIPEDQHWQSLTLRAWSAHLRGDHIFAIEKFQEAIKFIVKEFGHQDAWIQGMPGVCFMLSLFASEDPSHFDVLKVQSDFVQKNFGQSPRFGDFVACYRILYEVKKVLIDGGNIQDAKSIFKEPYCQEDPEAHLLKCYAHIWFGESVPFTFLETLAELMLEEHGIGNYWFVRQAAELLQKEEYKQADYKSKGNELLSNILATDFNVSPIASLSSMRPVIPQWLRALNALQSIADNKVSEDGQASLRMGWLFEENSKGYGLQPKEQKSNKNGEWTKGRNVALKKLLRESDSYPYLTQQDLTICQFIIREGQYRGHDNFALDHDKALFTAIGHPYVFNVHNEAIELYEIKPELLVRNKGEQLSVNIRPAVDEGFQQGKIVLYDADSERVGIMRIAPNIQKVLDIIGDQGLVVPVEAKEQVLKSLSALAPLLPIQSDIGGGSIDVSDLVADEHFYIAVQPHDNGLHFSLSIRPLGENGPRFFPGDGRSHVVADLEEERQQCQRDLKREMLTLENLKRICPSLDFVDKEQNEWLSDEQEALEILYQLQEAGDLVQILWPKDKNIRLSKAVGVPDVRASVKKKNDWFELQGELHLDDGQVFSMSKLIALMAEAPGRFVRLGENQFVTLTQELRRRLDAIGSHGKQQYHPLAAGALEELTQGMDVDTDPQWLQQKERLEEAFSFQAKVPKTLACELRDYQLEGFRWLSRLAQLGAGACLADDMGLGKTVQSLALILTRASNGPTLILAPTSVCMNWIAEAQRFAPSLNVMRFGSGDRQVMLDNLDAFDLVVCSYGLLQNEQERLQTVDWQTIVADEAQALKNAQTKRTKAALALNADFKMVATGTPIENHLGELWTLFQFINPGLLGSLESFNERFATPIENNQDILARKHLKRLVKPFILRRLKTEVLDELPPRTEITIKVPLSQNEVAFYEALRREAVEKLAKTESAQQMQALAEIMRLRRAACNPKLVTPDCGVSSSKLEAFGEILEELLENKHRALVFSQFVDHLSLIRDYLERRNVSFQYLDGSTSIKQREKAVKAFQIGEGDLFLISLKAGGSGLNLTGADYVVHMDPWWNPAVEDQASDRAHRLGQKRPVTIYRIVAENTIEEKILALHNQKRDLADSLLEGADMSGKLSVEDMMALIGEQI